MDEVLQRALKELERAGHPLVTRPPPNVIRLLRRTAAAATDSSFSNITAGLTALAEWLKENDLQGTGCVICDEGEPIPVHGCLGYLGPTGLGHLTGLSGPTGIQGSPAPTQEPHVHPSQAFPAQPKKQPLIRTFADQRHAKPQQQFKPKLRRRP